MKSLWLVPARSGGTGSCITGAHFCTCSSACRHLGTQSSPRSGATRVKGVYGHRLTPVVCSPAAFEAICCFVFSLPFLSPLPGGRGPDGHVPRNIVGFLPVSAWLRAGLYLGGLEYARSGPKRIPKCARVRPNPIPHHSSASPFHRSSSESWRIGAQ